MLLLLLLLQSEQATQLTRKLADDIRAKLRGEPAGGRSSYACKHHRRASMRRGGREA